MKTPLKIFCLLLFPAVACAQGGSWVWLKGSNTPNDFGSPGTQGVSNTSNEPEGRYQAANWIDQNGNFWIFGGLDNFHAERDDLYRYTPSTNTWTWMKGSLTNGNPGVYGTMGVPSPANNPGSRGWGKRRSNSSSAPIFFWKSRPSPAESARLK